MTVLDAAYHEIALTNNKLRAENEGLRAALAALYEDCRDGPASNQSMCQAREALGLNDKLKV